jgi:predicted extracellular nuclease
VSAAILSLAAGRAATAQVAPGAVPISRIQGVAHLSPMTGRVVVTHGVVTAVTADGFYLQDPVGDGDVATSEGIFVETGHEVPAAVAAGDRVRLRATVVEASSPGAPEGLRLTHLTQPAAIEVISRNQPLPDPVLLGAAGRPIPRRRGISPSELPVDLRDTAQVRRNRFNPDADALDFFESLEGMRVTLRSSTALSPTARRGGGRVDYFAGLDLPDGRARTVAGGLLLRGQNFDRLRIAFDPGLSGADVPVVATGDRTGGITGVMDYAYGAFQVRPTGPVVVTARSGWCPEVTELTRAPGRLAIASYNVLNLGADSSDDRQRERLAGQIVRSLRSPDILALQEVQDSSGERDDGVVDGRPTLRALAAAVQAAGGPAYAHVEVAPVNGRPGGAPGGNIRNAFLYDSGRVRLVAYRALTSAVLAAAGAADPAAFAESRDPLEAIFEFEGRRIIVINNHLTSRYGSTPVFGAVQPWVEAGEAEREAQVRALRAYVGDLVRRGAGARVIVLGDMNTFDFSDDLSALLPGRPRLLTNLVSRIEPAQRYTYIFEGNSQALDHIFVTASLAASAEVDIVHLNGDFAWDTEASDHDPVVARFSW